MKRIFTLFVMMLFKIALWFRYRVKVTGLDKIKLKDLERSGGLLFLPNHPTVFVDPTLITIAISEKFDLRPIITEYMYYAPVVNWFARYLNALPMPSFDLSTNSLKRKRSEKSLQEVVNGLERGENFLIYPGGGVKAGPREVIGGASGVHHVVSRAKDANIVLVKITGLYGSSFSKVKLGKTPPMFATILEGLKHSLKNLLFFNPRREVKIEFELAGNDFPREGSRLEMNRYLEHWYNRPDGLSETTEEYPGETLNLVSYSMWKDEFLSLKPEEAPKQERVDLSNVSQSVKDKVVEKLVKMTEMEGPLIFPDQDLSKDLGLDSLDISELVVFLEEEFDVHGVPVIELTTVGRLMQIAGGKVKVATEAEEEANITGWKTHGESVQLEIGEGDTTIETFLNLSRKRNNQVICGDMRSGIMNYSTMRMRVVLLAKYIQKLPGEHIGIMLPASTAASICILACQLANKVPVMINWTVGPRHLDHVLALSKVEKVLSSWSFIDRLSNVELSNVDEQLLMLEDLRRDITLFDKISAYFLAKRCTKSILKAFGTEHLKENDRAVLLFTSGTEKMPKGVPLTHLNILSNLKDCSTILAFQSDDVVLSMLPPFHAFGFSVTTMLPLLCGMKVTYFPDPTDSRHLAHAVEKWGATLVCGAPTFLKNMLKSAPKETFKSLRFVISGAEKAPQELFELTRTYGLGDVVEGYGITECSPVLTANRPGEKPCGVGRPLPNVKIRIVNESSGDSVPTGSQGMILASGPNVFNGYLNKEEHNPFREIDNVKWYVTGDLGFLDEKGNLHISGRLKRFIKVGAEMVSLGLIEHALLDAAARQGWELAQEGASIAICAQEEEGAKPRIYAFTIFPTTTEEVNAALRKEGISNLVKVTEVTQLDEIPLMGIGKINYRQLESDYVNV